MVLTFHTFIACLQVVFKFLVAWPLAAEGGVDDRDATCPASGAVFIEEFENIGVTPQEPEVSLHTPSNPHPTVTGHSHHDHLVRTTGCLEGLILAIFLEI